MSEMACSDWWSEGQKGESKKGGPLALVVHGGPWARDSWGYNPYCQWLNNRGYGAILINYRPALPFPPRQLLGPR